MRKIKMITTTMLLLLTAVVMAQGIRFEQDLSWKQVLAKAKRENKYIFVDAMATWCMPCKKMEMGVYPNPELGAFANEKFVSVKVQMDSTKRDSKYVISWYADAKAMMEKYGINAFPSYLFFSPEGRIVHRGGGLMDVGSFRALMADAMDLNKQEYGKYYALMEAYNKGKKDYKELPFMVEMSKKLKNKKLEQKLALDYIHNYLLKLGEAELYTADNIYFISSYVSSKDKAVFGMFYPDGSRTDRVAPGISAWVLSQVIRREEINAKIVRDNDYKQPKVEQPDWNTLAASIKSKYGVSGKAEIARSKQKWYSDSRPDGEKLALATVEYVEAQFKISEISNTLKLVGINNELYDDVAKVTDNREILLRAAKIQLKVINRNAEIRAKAGKRSSNWSMIDTYACLLYKVGQNSEAISWMEKAQSEVPEDLGVKQRIEQMKKGEKLQLK